MELRTRSTHLEPHKTLRWYVGVVGRAIPRLCVALLLTSTALVGVAPSAGGAALCHPSPPWRPTLACGGGVPAVETIVVLFDPPPTATRGQPVTVGFTALTRGEVFYSGPMAYSVAPLGQLPTEHQTTMVWGGRGWITFTPTSTPAWLVVVESSVPATTTIPVCGEPYFVTTTGSDVKSTGQSASVAAAVRDSCDRVVPSGTTVTFSRTGANPGISSAVTDSNGQATHSWTGVNAGIDRVQASVAAGIVGGEGVVVWATPTTCQSMSGVVLCLTPTATVVVDQPLVIISTSPGPTHTVAAYLDSYRFTLPGGVVTTLPCVTLVTDTEVNPCATAGGTFLSRSTLVTQTVTESDVGSGQTVARVRICEATLTATVNGFGVNSAPVLTPC